MNTTRTKTIALCALLTLIALCAAGCQSSGSNTVDTGSESNPVAVITMESGAVMTLELYPSIAPNTVANFITLAQDGYYDGLIFHRVIAGFMIQGGDPEGTGTGGPGYTIKGEFSANGFENNLKHERGVLSMARTNQSNDTAGSQFFIMLADATHLDGQYAAFGRIMDEESLKTLDAIGAVRTNAADKPVATQRIRTITVDTKGKTYTVKTIQ